MENCEVSRVRAVLVIIQGYLLIWGYLPMNTLIRFEGLCGGMLGKMQVGEKAKESPRTDTRCTKHCRINRSSLFLACADPKHPELGEPFTWLHVNMLT